MLLPYFILVMTIFGRDSGTIARSLTNSTTVTPMFAVGSAGNYSDGNERVDIVGDVFVDEFSVVKPAALSEDERKISTLQRVLQKVSR